MAAIIFAGSYTNIVLQKEARFRPRISSATSFLRWKPLSLSFRASASPKTTVVAEEAKTGRPVRGLMKPKPVSSALQAFLGVKEVARTEALKQIWAYVKQNNLQDAENKKFIICDGKLKSIFGGRDRVGFLEVSGLLNPHFLKQ
ncbi:Zinc finger CCCH domain-containing protein 19 [Apostasia shenzhenica]|uniref:Zinc finger CCCH domain-containing protein 19 n=1 Tax=Apostasia shenzhenica TaxID=1088818 RepID=A0A2I0ADS8_9ASPA|nr:Zinc finger CCCH domain-containing protein 19 [Apostasia shenzhenica]